MVSNQLFLYFYGEYTRCRGPVPDEDGVLSQRTLCLRDDIKLYVLVNPGRQPVTVSVGTRPYKFVETKAIILTLEL